MAPDVITGISTARIDKYSFQHKVADQVAACERVLKPAPHGYHKRIRIFNSSDRPRIRAGQKSDNSGAFLKRLHAWMQAGPLETSEVAALDDYARAMCDLVSTAIENFLGDPPGPLSEAFRTKIGFFDTDLQRLAHVNLRHLELILSERWPNWYERLASLGVIVRARDPRVGAPATHPQRVL